MTTPAVSEAVLETLPDELAWTGRASADVLAKLPGKAAVYLLRAEDGAPIQLASTQHLRRLATARLLDPAENARARADLAAIARSFRYRVVHSAFEARWRYYRLARQLYPGNYRRLISFGRAWFLHVDWNAPIPEISVSEHVWDRPGEFVGPWLTHDLCLKALHGLWDLFDLCRTPEQVRRAPQGQRCAYAEMGRCDAPCDGSVPLEVYAQRCRAAWAFARGAVRNWIEDARQRMKAAAAEQRYEYAAQLKHSLSFAWKWNDQWSSEMQYAERFNFVFVVPVVRRRSWKVFLFLRGTLVEGPICTDRRLPETICAWLPTALSAPPESDGLIRSEQTWLFAHFLHSREGDASLAWQLPEAQVPGALAEDVQQALRTKRALNTPKARPGEGEMDAAPE